MLPWEKLDGSPRTVNLVSSNPLVLIIVNVGSRGATAASVGLSGRLLPAGWTPSLMAAGAGPIDVIVRPAPLRDSDAGSGGGLGSHRPSA
jgi:hypothetical protein